MLSINLNKIKYNALAYMLICCLTACGGASEEGGLIPGSESASESASNSVTSGSNSSQQQSSSSTSASSATYSAIVEWDIPTTRENGDELLLSEIGGYEILYKMASNDQYTTVVVTDQTQSAQNITNLAAGRYEVRVAVFDADGVYSEYSSPTYADVGI